MTEPETDEGNRLEGLALTLIFTAVALLLLALLPLATRVGQASGGWWTRPALAPGLALATLSAANLITLWRAAADLRRTPPSAAERAEARQRLRGWLLPVEFLAYYALYVYAVQHLGYFPSSLLFILGLLLRVGLNGPKWLLAGACAALALTAVFRMGLGVWMPAPEVYDLFPGPVRTALIRWF